MLRDLSDKVQLGRPELNIKPWEALRREIEEGNAMASWTDRAPYAYWKGNPNVGAGRRFLLRCNTSGNRDWNARIYAQDRGRSCGEDSGLVIWIFLSHWNFLVFGSIK